MKRFVVGLLVLGGPSLAGASVVPSTVTLSGFADGGLDGVLLLSAVDAGAGQSRSDPFDLGDLQSEPGAEGFIALDDRDSGVSLIPAHGSTPEQVIVYDDQALGGDGVSYDFSVGSSGSLTLVDAVDESGGNDLGSDSAAAGLTGFTGSVPEVSGVAGLALAAVPLLVRRPR